MIDLQPDMDTALTATGTTTKAEAMLMIMSHAAKHKITGCQLHDLLQLINQLFGQEVVPRSKYLFNRVFKNSCEEVEFQLYCENCNSNIGTTQEINDRQMNECRSCGSTFEFGSMNGGNFFINVPLAPQIQTLLESTEVSGHLNYRFDRQKSHNEMLSDIYDGEKYRELSSPNQILSDSHNLSYIFNSDGSPVFNSSKFSIWPIHIMINELPPEIRFKHVLLAGLWFGPKEPLMEVFLK